MPIHHPDQIDQFLARSFARNAAEWVRAEARTALGLAADLVEIPPRLTGGITKADGIPDIPKLRTLRAAWQTVAERPGWTVEWETKRLVIGENTLPVRVTVASPAALCAALRPGGVGRSDWHGAVGRIARIARHFALEAGPGKSQSDPVDDLVRILKSSDSLWPKDFSAEEESRLIALTDWLLAHPGSGLFVRAIPVEGVDTKWLERHLAVTSGLWGLVREVRTGLPAPAKNDFIREAGLRSPSAYVHVRHAAVWTGDPEVDAKVPLEHIAAHEPAADTVIIIENAQTGLSVTAPAGIPIILAMGGSVTDLQAVPWLTGKRILYFGDLDTHGLNILALCRRTFPRTENLLMDCETFRHWEHLAVPEPSPFPTVPDGLTESERELFKALSASDHGRLEQERIPLDAINAAIEQALRR
ncbi:Wadjet anti-phage system protein JetD domain-containing protein [Sutterella sp.]|uniref:Wadjet anti-phage system protein JetD domain-containing protein n=1 Tax=Sutterella sp. TaxID=1981025 RepID=UPI0026E09086|nr:Wadjet anti-phage system protein JetD domain-containing protein [Sutterella sp.]MDO5532459.1 DUF2220 family protein [Sutterella sp.]